MKQTIYTLLTSKRTLIAFLTAVANVLLFFGIDVDPSVRDAFATMITTLAGVLIAGISASDYASALNMPAGLDHKGRSLAEGVGSVESFIAALAELAELSKSEDEDEDEAAESADPQESEQL